MTPRALFAVLLAAFASAALAGDRAASRASEPARAVPAPAQDAALVARGAALLASNQCARCHASTGIPELAARPLGESCSGCHDWIQHASHDPVERAAARERYPLWDRYETRVKHFLAVPDLAASGARLDPAWVARYLRAPYKVRPALGEEMIRTPLSAADARAIAARLAAARPTLTGPAAAAHAIPVSRASRDLEAGEHLYESFHCGACHAFGARAASPGIAAAPDLAHARERMRPEDVAAFITDPTAFGTATAMPSFELTPEQAARLRDFVVGAPLEPPPAEIAPPDDLPLLARTVTWQEVDDRVFGAICIHCHMDEETNAGDGGPGNTGGLGYDGVGLSLESWDGVVRGAIGPDGERVSILEPGPHGEEPPLLARLRRRYGENARERVGGDAVAAEVHGEGWGPGMPLGLPALSPEDFQLVRTWLAQGARGPDGRAAIAPAAGGGAARATPLAAAVQAGIFGRAGTPSIATCAASSFEATHVPALESLPAAQASSASSASGGGIAPRGVAVCPIVRPGGLR